MHYFTKEIKQAVVPILDLLKENQTDQAWKEIAHLSLKLICQIESQTMTPQEANNYFLYLMITLDDHFPKIKKTKDVDDLIFEGNILHDYGTEFGPDLDYMKLIAHRVLNETK